GLQSPGQHVEHRVRPQPPVQRVAVAVQRRVALQRAPLQRAPRRQFGAVAAVVEHPVERGMHVRDVVALEEVVHVDLPVAGDVVGGMAVGAMAGEVACRAQAGVDASHQVLERHRRGLVHRREQQALPLAHRERGQADVVDPETLGRCHLRRGFQLSIERIGPAVVAATQRACRAPVAGGDRPRAMPADVVEGAHRAVGTPHRQHRQAGAVRDDVVARVRQAGHVREQVPAAVEHAFAFQRHGPGIVVPRGGQGIHRHSMQEGLAPDGPTQEGRRRRRPSVLRGVARDYWTRTVTPAWISTSFGSSALPSACFWTTTYWPVGTRRRLYLPAFSTWSSRSKPLLTPRTWMVSPAWATPWMLPEVDWAWARPTLPTSRAAVAARVRNFDFMMLDCVKVG